MKKHSIGGKLFAAAAALSMLTGYAGLPLHSETDKSITATAADMQTGNRILVDLTKNDGRPAAHAPYANNWVVDGSTSASTTISGLSITLSASGGNLRVEDNKKLHFYNDKYSRLMCDGVTVDANSGGTLKLTIKGLSDEKHSIKTYHGATGSETTSQQTVTVNGVTNSGIACPNQVLNDDDAGISYTEFTGTSVTVEIKPGSKANAWLNAFEIDGGDPIKGVNHTYPLDQERHLQTDVGLSWKAGTASASYNVYIGTSYDSVFGANTNSSEFKGNQSGTSFKLNDSYSSLEPYYWRIDSVASDGTVIKGSVYSFYTARLAFPTAEGYGRFARGGRGGYVYHVTNLSDDGKEGSLRYGPETLKGSRTVVFDVGGVIPLKSVLCIPEDGGDVYVAGQTAPGDGITLINYTFGALGAQDVIIRDIRTRVGDVSDKSMGGMGLGSCNHSIVDHCSISWAIDEGFSSRAAKNITFQWNIIGESLHDSVHYNKDRTGTSPHAFAASVGGDKGSFHHNLLINCTGRNWSIAGGLEQSAQEYAGYLDISNNVVYNWRDRTTDGGINSLNFVNNYYKAGAESNTKLHFVNISDEICPGIQKMYISGNKMVNSNGSVIVNSNEDAWKNGRAKITSKNQTQAQGVMTKPMWEDYIELESADDAYKSVTSSVGAGGASVTGWDYIDSRYIKEVTKGTYTYKGSKQGLKGIIDSQKDVGGYPSQSTFKHSTDGLCNSKNDTDRDGISDEWEKKHGLDPNNVSDGAMVSLSTDGYTNLEMFLNELAGDDVMITQLQRDPLKGSLISTVEVLDTAYYSGWSINTSLDIGDTVFGDRAADKCAASEMPPRFKGAEVVLTSCDAKNSSKAQAKITAAEDITLYVGFDSRVTNIPAWTSGWTKEIESIKTSNGVTFNLYSKKLSAGESTTLGANGQSTGCMNYIVIASEDDGTVIGDVNMDGKFDSIDLKLFQKWLLGVPDTKLANWKAGDLCEDDVLDVYDLVMMRKLLASE